MVLEVQSNVVRVYSQHLNDLGRHGHSHFLLAAVLEPNLEIPFFGPDADSHPKNVGLAELLACCCHEKDFPDSVHIVALFGFQDPDSAILVVLKQKSVTLKNLPPT